MVVCPNAQEYDMTRFDKECFKCKAIKPIAEFYKHSMMADGHLNKCKECAKNDATEHRNKNIEKVRAYDKARAKEPHRAKLAAEVNKAWRAEDARRSKAHGAVASAIRKGLLVSTPCIRCGEQKSLAHHEDYDKPLEVMWLCQPCHKQRHKEILKKD
jgi:ribosomal protein S27AE